MIAEAVAAADNPNAAAGRGVADAAAARRRRPPAASAGVPGTRQILLTGVSYMIPFVAAGGLLIALGFLLGGYDIANTPDGATHRSATSSPAQLADQPARRRTRPVPRRRAVHPRRPGLRLPGAGARRLHRVRDRRPAGHRARLHRRCSRGLRRRRLHRRHRRRSARRLRRAVDQPARRAAVAARPDARRHHPAVRLDHRRSADVPAARPTAGGDHLRADRLAQRPVRQLGDPARHHPRPDDVLRPRWPGQQGRLRLRHRRAQRRRPARRCAIMAAVMAAGMVPPLAMALASTAAAAAVQRAGAGERQGRLAARCVASSPRAPSRSPLPTRSASSRR